MKEGPCVCRGLITPWMLLLLLGTVQMGCSCKAYRLNFIAAPELVDAPGMQAGIQVLVCFAPAGVVARYRELDVDELFEEIDRRIREMSLDHAAPRPLAVTGERTQLAVSGGLASDVSRIFVWGNFNTKGSRSNPLEIDPEQLWRPTFLFFGGSTCTVNIRVFKDGFERSPQ